MKRIGLTFLMNSGIGALLFAVGLPFAFLFGMDHSNTAPEWYAVVGRVLWWPGMLLVLTEFDDSFATIFMATALGWGLALTGLYYLYRFLKRRLATETPNQSPEPTAPNGRGSS